jgi:CheY-like chemotaxis protein
MNAPEIEFVRDRKTRKGLLCIQRAIACRVNLQYNLREPLSEFSSRPDGSRRKILNETLQDFGSFSPWSTRPVMPDTLLLIDDNAIQAATRQTILKRAGYFVIAALNPQRALEQFRAGEFPANVQLVITDHIMPGMSGSDFVRELRKTFPKLPVLVISGMEEAEAEYEGMNVLFRLKPLLPDHLLASVQSLIHAREVEPA